MEIKKRIAWFREGERMMINGKCAQESRENLPFFQNILNVTKKLKPSDLIRL